MLLKPGVEDAPGDFSWQHEELRHSADPHIKRPEDQASKILSSPDRSSTSAHMYAADTCQAKASFIQIQTEHWVESGCGLLVIHLSLSESGQ